MGFNFQSKPSIAVQGGHGTDVFTRGYAGPQTPGQTAAMPKNNGGKWAVGGKTKMFGPQCAEPAKPK